MDTFEPVEHIHPLLGVQHPHEAGEDSEDGGLRGPEAVHDQGGLVGARGGQAGDAVHQVYTVTDRHTQMRPVGAKHHLVSDDVISSLVTIIRCQLTCTLCCSPWLSSLRLTAW